jgi:hypothetical protein
VIHTRCCPERGSLRWKTGVGHMSARENLGTGLALRARGPTCMLSKSCCTTRFALPLQTHPTAVQLQYHFKQHRSWFRTIRLSAFSGSGQVYPTGVNVQGRLDFDSAAGVQVTPWPLSPEERGDGGEERGAQPHGAGSHKVEGRRVLLQPVRQVHAWRSPSSSWTSSGAGLRGVPVDVLPHGLL